jgi:hypothetical protein
MNAPARAAAPPRRMTLTAVTRGRVATNLRVLLMGVPGVGKTTFAAGAPAPIFIGGEDGANNLDVARFPLPGSWPEVLEAVRALAQEEHVYKTLVVDTLDSLEPLVWRAIVARDGKAQNIEQVGGGYGKGYSAAVDEWRVLLAELERVRSRMHVVLLAHCQVKSFKNPSGADYDRYQMKLEQRAGAVFSEWVDAHLFAQFEGGVHEERGKRAKGWSSEVRVLHTRRTAAWDGKNRYDLPETLPLDWADLWEAVQSGRDQGALRARVEAMIERLGDADRTKASAALARATDGVQLAQLENWAATKLPKEGEQ